MGMSSASVRHHQDPNAAAHGRFLAADDSWLSPPNKPREEINGIHLQRLRYGYKLDNVQAPLAGFGTAPRTTADA
jgi:hypothetical protein